jgi:hypothetical protein
MRRVVFAILVAAAAAGCAHEYTYWPVTPGNPAAPAVRYPVPAEAPQGEVFVTSFGFTSMEVAAGRNADLLHARLVAVNNGGLPWTVDGRAQQLLTASGQPPLGPAFINTDATAGPVYTVPPAQRRVFDLYYAVPAPLDQPAQLGGFELAWRVDVAGGPVSGRTPFQRFEGRPGTYDTYPPYLFVGLGWGVGWWWGPAYPFHYRPVIRTYYYPPVRARTYGPWQGVPRTTPPPGWRGSPPPPPGGGSWRGTPAPRPSGGGWRGSPRPR